ncbi:DUF3368 domain-containing protein [Moorena producens JHB]|uniref:DUF3368 domain-containing protein n=1 Tax=Moorena producens (strain JHB) TaxID=1454205 RepID=A0A1D9G9Z2_MOOP1|nr:DUF3368 domain-containing protein [Moorena producens]AOY84200.1 DUF3368 domain-containing protein [Moorena producens JHB]
MTIVSNTSPISNLARVGQLNLLQQLYGTVLIPMAVHQELLDHRAGKAVITAVQLATWITVKSVQNQAVVSELRNRLNVGEAEAIALAMEIKATHLLIDERLGRQAATDLGLRIIGVLGILLTAKRQGMVPAIKPIMDDLINQAGFRVSSKLYSEVLKTAHE